MKLFTTFAATLILANAVVAEPTTMIVYSQEYALEAWPGAGATEWARVGMRLCIMMEEFSDVKPEFPDRFTEEAGIKDMDLTDKDTRLSAVPNTMLSMPCWERKDLNKAKTACSTYHIDESADGKYRVYLCES